MRFISYLAAAVPVLTSISVVLAGTTPEEVEADLVDLSRRSNTIGAFAKLVTDENAEDMSKRIITAVERLNEVLVHARGRLQKSDRYEPGADADHVLGAFSRFSDKTINATGHLIGAHDELEDTDEKALSQALNDLYGSLTIYNRELYCVLSKVATTEVISNSARAELAVASVLDDYNHPDEARTIDSIFEQFTKKMPRRQRVSRVWRLEI